MSKVEEFWQDVADATDCGLCRFYGVCNRTECVEMFKTAYIKAAVEDRQTAREDSE